MRKLILVLMIAALQIQAATIVFDFEDQPLATGLTTLSMTEMGITLTITRQNGSPFSIIDLGPLAPSGWGARTLSPFADPQSLDPFILSFSPAVTQVSAELGDYGADSDSYSLSLQEPGSPSASGLWGTRDLAVDPSQTVLVSASATSTALLAGGSAAVPSSLFFDNITVEAIPEPGTLFPVLCAIGGLAALRIRSWRG